MKTRVWSPQKCRNGVFDKVLPIFVFHSALSPLNLLRLRQAIRFWRSPFERQIHSREAAISEELCSGRTNPC